MGLLVDGVWHDKWYDTKASGGRFVRSESAFREWVTPEQARPGRYHLYIAHACPWAHRTVLARLLKGLEEVVSCSAVEPLMLERGWTFAAEGELHDPLHGARALHEIYTRSEPRYSGRVTVPVLWDQHEQRIVCNESAEIVRMFDSSFAALAAADAPTLYPEPLRADIDAVNARVYPAVNNGVYRCGFATTQAAYDDAFAELFAELDRLDAQLASARWLVGNRFTEADLRLFTTLVRFDAVYVGHFKCNRQRIADYPHLSGFLRDLYQLPGVAATVRMDQIKTHYYGSHATINPTGIVPAGPRLDLDAPHGRERLGPPALSR